MIDLDVVGVRMEMPANSPIVLLREREGSRYLPIWVGAVEASAIAYAHQGVVPPRPLTHDLVIDLLTALGTTVDRVEITDLSDGVFFATIHLSSGQAISARPSDAIALALRAGAPISGAVSVLDAAGVELPDEEPQAAPEDLEQFREFLENVNPEDFGTPES